MDERVVERSKQFDKSLKHIKDKNLRIRIGKQIEKIIKNPQIGDFLSYGLKGNRKIYIPPFRLIYFYDKEKNLIKLLDFEKRDKVYRRK